MAEYTLGPGKHRPCIMCGQPIVHGSPFATCSDACGRAAREVDLDRALEQQRKRLDGLHRLALEVSAPRALILAIEECMHGNARLQTILMRRRL